MNVKCKICLTFILCSLMSSFYLSSITVIGQEGPKYGGTIIIPIDTDPITFCPVLVQTDQSNLPHQNVFNALVRMNKNLEPIPDLAKSWEISPDGLTYTFHLYDNVTWHDGTPFTSADVKFTFDLYLTQPLPMSGTFEVIDSIETPDDYTVIFKLKNIFPPLMATGFAFWRGNKIMPKHLYEGTDVMDNPHNLDPIGTGPFKFKEWVKGSHITLVRNENYFKKGLPYLDKIILKISPSTEATKIGFETGEISTMGVTPCDVEEISSIPGATVVDSPSGSASCMYIGLNIHDNEYLANLKVRQALVHAIDKEEFIDLALCGRSNPSISFLSSNLGWAFNPNVPQYEHSTEKAEELLDQAGYARGSDGIRFSLRLYTMTSEDWVQMSQIIKAQLKEVGIDVKVMPLEWATLFNKIATEYDFDMQLMGHGTGPDPDRLYGRFLTSEIIPGTWQYMRYSNSRVDELWAASRNTAEIEERQELFWEIQEIILTDLPMMPLYEVTSYIAFRSEFHGLPIGGYGTLDLWEAVWTERGSTTTPQIALETITSAEDEINAKEEEGYDITRASSKLADAKEAYDSGDYDMAKILANDSTGLVLPPQKPGPIPTWVWGVIGLLVIVVFAEAGYIMKMR